MKFKRFFLKIVIAGVLVILLGIYTQYFQYIHARTVDGMIDQVERVTEPTAILGNIPTSQIFSFAVAIKDKTGEIFVSSTEDRQWAVAKKGMCAEAVFYPYPPWDLEKAGTYHNARLKRLYECPGN